MTSYDDLATLRSIDVEGWKRCDGWAPLVDARACFGVKTRVLARRADKKQSDELISSALLSRIGSDDGPSQHVLAVTELSLPGNRLRTLPHEALGRLKRLVKLELPSNGFRGRINLRCPTLRILVLSANRFTGPIDLTACRGLVELRLDKNHLDGPLKLAANVEILDVHSNRLTGPALPHDLLTGCPRLRDVRLGDNRLDSLDVAVTAPTIQRLELHTNKLTGDLSPSIAFFPGLTHLDLCRNELSGDLPVDALSRLTRLKALYLNKNGFNRSRRHAAQLQLSLGLHCLVSVDADD